MVEEDALPVDIRAVDGAFRVATVVAPTARIDANDLVIAAMHHQQAVRPFRVHHKVVAVVEEHLVLLPIEEAQVIRSRHQLIFALENGRPVDTVQRVLVVRLTKTLFQINVAGDLESLLRAHQQKDDCLRAKKKKQDER